jgi:ABC-type transporter Mla maintaining outer membrane lipid asymmetry ATPase subunit MlaF/ABC-type transporter Mla maintaining outer membrane lipid asymmetry permease subunit MlaE
MPTNNLNCISVIVTVLPDMSDPTLHAPIYVSVKIQSAGPRCPFGFPSSTRGHGGSNTTVKSTDHPTAPTEMDRSDTLSFSICRGGCVWIQGPSGRGKTTIATSIIPELHAAQQPVLRHLDVKMNCIWDDDIPYDERCGILFQQTTLLDELTVAGNLALALIQGRGIGRDSSQKEKYEPISSTDTFVPQQIKYFMELVGLDYNKDAEKRIMELSGGMARRVGLAMQLAHRKHVIVLDEPFTGLDYDTAVSIAKELVHLRQTMGTAFVLIAHEPNIAQIVLAEGICKGNVIVPLLEPSRKSIHFKRGRSIDAKTLKIQHKLHLFGTRFRDRFLDKTKDYLLYSTPLIVCTFLATGMAIAMLSADSLQRLDVTKPVLHLVDQEVRPLIQLLTGAEPTTFHMLGVRMKVRSMLNTTVPVAKQKLYAIGLSQLFVLEIGPLLTALLLSGRIGGSYAGAVATMHATAQTKLLYTVGISPRIWSFYPAIFAACIAGPLLTILGTFIALFLAGWVGQLYGIGSVLDYWTQMQITIFPPSRLRGWEITEAHPDLQVYQLDFYRTTFSPNLIDTVIEVVTYPIVFSVIKAVVFVTIIVCTGELCARYHNVWRNNHSLTYRDVPHVITTAVVTSSLFIILMDWVFSRIWLQRR